MILDRTSQITRNQLDVYALSGQTLESKERDSAPCGRHRFYTSAIKGTLAPQQSDEDPADATDHDPLHQPDDLRYNEFGNVKSWRSPVENGREDGRGARIG